MGTYDGAFRPVLFNDPSKSLAHDTIGPQLDLAEAAAEQLEDLIKLVLDRFAKAIGLGGLTDLAGWSDAVSGAMQFFQGILSGLDITSAGEFITKLMSIQTLAQDAMTAVGTAVEDAVSAAVSTVVDGMNGIGSVANLINQAMAGLINEILGSIFGDGGTKWGQEVLAAAGPVIVGYNDIPLGFGMPFSGKVTDLAFYSSEHLSTGSGSKATIELRRNGSAIYTANWNGGSNSTTVEGLNLAVTKLDRITFYVTAITSQLANMSISVVGKYV